MVINDIFINPEFIQSSLFLNVLTELASTTYHIISYDISYRLPMSYDATLPVFSGASQSELKYKIKNKYRNDTNTVDNQSVCKNSNQRGKWVYYRENRYV